MSLETFRKLKINFIIKVILFLFLLSPVLLFSKSLKRNLNSEDNKLKSKESESKAIWELFNIKEGPYVLKKGNPDTCPYINVTWLKERDPLTLKLNQNLSFWKFNLGPIEDKLEYKDPEDCIFVWETTAKEKEIQEKIQSKGCKNGDYLDSRKLILNDPNRLIYFFERSSKNPGIKNKHLKCEYSQTEP